MYELFFFDGPDSSRADSSIVPSTKVAGRFTFYVAEGVTDTIYGPKVPIAVTVNPAPEAFAGFDKAICSGDTIQIGGDALPGSNYSWTSNPPGFASSASDPFVSPKISTNYTVIETIVETGCSDTTTMNNGVFVYPLPTADFKPSTQLAFINNTIINFENQSKDAVSYEWDFGDDSQIITEVNPNHTYDNFGYFNVHLTAINEAGCKDTTMQQITVTFDKLYPPTIFSPNSSNPDEQEFRIYSEWINENGYRLQIFNRWGEIIFESFTMEEGWDGRMSNGNLAPSGVYTWVIDYSDFTGEQRSQEGTITLFYQVGEKAGKLYPPTAFSPNSIIEEDREFRIYSPDVSENGYRLLVISRWGEIIFESESQEKGWDGKMKNGNPAPSGVYAWHLQYVDLNGVEYKQQVNVTLLY